jgi:dimeric dUTPase (all-alpha-NTP-PPase superfamily)
LAELLGLSAEQIEQAYIAKNEVNYDRQRKGY